MYKQHRPLELREQCLLRSHVANGNSVIIHAVGVHCAIRAPVENVGVPKSSGSFVRLELLLDLRAMARLISAHDELQHEADPFRDFGGDA